MSSSVKNLSEFNPEGIPSASGMSFGIVVSTWNAEITEVLYQGAEHLLIQMGCQKDNIIRVDVPGSFEIPLAAKLLYLNRRTDAVICLGCVIQGETPHFDFICKAVSEGLMQLNVEYAHPFIFGILTTLTIKQAKERAGGKLGNKGIEAAVTAIQMAALKKQIGSPE